MELQQIEIACCSIQMQNNIKQAVPSNNAIKITNAKYPLFDETTISLRALIAVILGSDVFVGRVHNIGASKLYNKIKSIREEQGEDGDDNGVIENITN